MQQEMKLRRRIANMGTINPDAAQEYRFELQEIPSAAGH